MFHWRMPNPCSLCKSWVSCGLPAHLAAHTCWVVQHRLPQVTREPTVDETSIDAQHGPAASPEPRAEKSQKCGVTVRAETSSPECPSLACTVLRAPMDVLARAELRDRQELSRVSTTSLAAWGQWPQLPATAVGSKYEAWDRILPAHLPWAPFWWRGEGSHYLKSSLNCWGSQNITTWGV